MDEWPANHEVPGWEPRPLPQREPLIGSRVRLEPIDPARHATDLFGASHGPTVDPAHWRYLPYGPFADEHQFTTWLRSTAASNDPLWFAIVDTRLETATGMASFLRMVPEDGVIEIGHIWFGATLRRTPLATEAIYLMAQYVFDTLGYRRLEWKCNAANALSRRAAVRFGFTYEGTFRQHKVVRGYSRDTAWYAMLDGEWPECGAAFEAWLAPENFDAEGNQRRSLSSLRTPNSGSPGTQL